MKKLLIMAMACAAVAAPEIASATNAYVGTSYQTNDDAELSSYALSGAMTMGAHVQLDGLYANLQGDYDEEVNAVSLGGHVFERTDQVLYGGYVGYTHLGSNDDSDYDELAVAAEGQLYSDAATWTGSAAYIDGSVSDGVDTDDYHFWSIDGEYRRFFTDNVSAYALLGYADGEVEGFDSFDGFTYGLGAEWQLSSAPVSFHAGWEKTEITAAGSDEESSAYGFGVRSNFGGGTLRDRSQRGPGLLRPAGLAERAFAGFSPR